MCIVVVVVVVVVVRSLATKPLATAIKTNNKKRNEIINKQSRSYKVLVN